MISFRYILYFTAIMFLRYLLMKGKYSRIRNHALHCRYMKLRGNSFFQRVPQYVEAFKVKIWINNINGIGEFFRMFGAQE